MELTQAKRVVALTRQIASYMAMLKQGVLTEKEVNVMVSACRAEINQLRGQDDLPLVSEPDPLQGKAKKA